MQCRLVYFMPWACVAMQSLRLEENHTIYIFHRFSALARTDASSTLIVIKIAMLSMFKVIITFEVFVFDSAVVDRNFISRTDKEQINGIRLDFFKISSVSRFLLMLAKLTLLQDSKWLVTVESRSELSGQRTSCLKFWERSQSSAM